MVVRRKIPLCVAYTEVIEIVARVNPSARHARVRVCMNIVCSLQGTKWKLSFRKLAAKIRSDP